MKDTEIFAICYAVSYLLSAFYANELTRHQIMFGVKPSFPASSLVLAVYIFVLTPVMIVPTLIMYLGLGIYMLGGKGYNEAWHEVIKQSKYKKDEPKRNDSE
jgi:hypothetical protein